MRVCNHYLLAGNAGEDIGGHGPKGTESGDVNAPHGEPGQQIFPADPAFPDRPVQILGRVERADRASPGPVMLVVESKNGKGAGAVS